MRINTHEKPVVCSASAATVPQRPTVEQMTHARNRLLELVQDFPFVDEVDRAVWFAGLMTGVMRYDFKGQAPLFFVEGERGTGKSLLVSTASVLATGRLPAVFCPWRSEREAGAAMSAVARNRTPVAVVDNVTGAFASSSLTSFLTCTHLECGELGSAQIRRFSPQTVWWATGATARAVTSDHGPLRRATLRIRLDVGPQERRASSFRVPNLGRHLFEHLAGYLADINTLRSGFDEFARLQPAASASTEELFGGWSRTVGALVIFAGMVDPMGGQCPSEVQ